MLLEVGAGCIWSDVDKVSLEHGIYVGVACIERCPDVGVAGFTLGGGFSLLSNQYGLASDNVVSYEVVLPDGTIKDEVVDADTDTSALFHALNVRLPYDDDV